MTESAVKPLSYLCLCVAAAWCLRGCLRLILDIVCRSRSMWAYSGLLRCGCRVLTITTTLFDSIANRLLSASASVHNEWSMNCQSVQHAYRPAVSAVGLTSDRSRSRSVAAAAGVEHNTNSVKWERRRLEVSLQLSVTAHRDQFTRSCHSLQS